MDIRVISSHTREDEARLASRVLEALTAVLDSEPAAYVIRVETPYGQLMERAQLNPVQELSPMRHVA